MFQSSIHDTVAGVSTADRKHSTLFFRLAQTLSVLLSLFYVLPGQFFGTVGAGLDPSWQLALHEAFDKGRIFGREFVFTYGPLGWLSTRLPYPSTAPLLLCADIILGCITSFAFCAITFNLTRWHQLIPLPLICWAAGSPFFSHNLVMLMFSLEIIYLILFIRSANWFYLLPAALLATCAFCVKLNIGFVSLGAFFLALLLISIRDRASLLKGSCCCVLMFGLLLLTGRILHVDLVGYTLGSLSIAQGYNDAMPLPPIGREHYVWTALIVVGLFGLWFLGNIKMILRNKDTLLAGLVTPLFLFLLFKQAFVRADEHVYEFIAWCSVPVGIMAWAGINRLRLSFLPIAGSILVTPFLGNEGKVSIEYSLNRAVNFSTYLSQVEQRAENSRNIPLPIDDTLPHEIIEKIGDGSVDIFPWEISALLANKLNYRPRPVPQSYVSYTEYLDRLNEKFFDSTNRPTYIVYAHHCADHRYCNFDDSKSRLAILKNYDVVGKWGYHLLLQSRATPRSVEVIQGPTGAIPFGKSFKVPDTPGLLLARINLEHSPIGKIFSTLYQSTSVEIVFTTGKSRSQAYRAIPPILKGGVILNRLVENIDDAENLFSHSADIQKVTKLRISSIDPFAYKTTLKFSSEEFRFSESLNREGL